MGLHPSSLGICATRRERSGSKETEKNGKKNEEVRNDVEGNKRMLCFVKGRNIIGKRSKLLDKEFSFFKRLDNNMELQ